MQQNVEMVMWKLVYTHQAKKDAKKIAASALKLSVEKLLYILQHDPLQNPPPFEKLVGDLFGAYSRRINIQHRLIYQLYVNEKMIKIIRMWTHYE